MLRLDRGTSNLHRSIVDESMTFTQMQGRRRDSTRRLQRDLPVIAPRGEGGTSAESFGSTVASNFPVDVPRTRLPPRSRSGCWTCRQRKVKCDEQRPTCGQCARLNHTCDYNPRLLFRDDTPRVKDRLSEVRSEESAVWDSSVPEPDFELDSTVEDVLPAFGSLTTDEERERKAQSAPKKGTYVVVANPMSFWSLPEYRDNDSMSVSTRFPGRHDPFDTPFTNQSVSGFTEDDDPDVVILKKFEDTTRKGSAASSGFVPSMESPTLSFHSHSQPFHGRQQSMLELPPAHLQIEEELQAPHEATASLLDRARNGGSDWPLLQHYRTVISPSVIKFGHQVIPEDIFEIEARTYRPLFHAMMAISALSLAHRSGVSSTDAMMHYGQVISALQEASEKSSTSDGAMFTHYLLLLYEIFDAGSKDSAMWSYHCDALLRIITERRRIDNTVPHPIIVWMTYLIDTYALLSGSGSGTFIQSLAAGDLTPELEYCLPPLGPNDPQCFFPGETAHLPNILALTKQTVYLAVQIGQSARELRAEEERRRVVGPNALGPEYVYERTRHARVQSVQNLCRHSSQAWATTYTIYWPYLQQGVILPSRALRALKHAQNLYRACVIYAHTSMYPGQMTKTSPEYHHEVPSCIDAILNSATNIINSEQWEINCLIFALFMAGFASLDVRQKNLAVQLLLRLEPQSMGANTTSIRRLLQHVYVKQHARIDTIGYDFTIDWKSEMELMGRGLIMFGM